MRISLPKNVNVIIESLEAAGYEAYAVGGCVRDSILGREPEDWDITTSALPEEVKAIFPRTIDTGIEHGTVTVMMEHVGYEVTTYRIDGKYTDGRHPDKVEFTPNLTEDLRRRDFTINAMAYNESSGLVDLYGGKEDIENKIIRCVGEAKERFNEDALRILRAVRFSAQLGFEIEDKTREEIKRQAVNLKKISVERIQTELVKMLVSDNPGHIRECYKLGITDIILPEFNKMMETPQQIIFHIYDVGEHSIKVLEHVKPEKVVRIAALLHDVAKPYTALYDDAGNVHFKGHPEMGVIMAQDILRRLKFDNDTIAKVKTLIKYHDCRPKATLPNIRRLLKDVGEELFPLLIDIKYGDIAGQSDFRREEKLATVKAYEELFHKIIEEKQCYKWQGSN